MVFYMCNLFELNIWIYIWTCILYYTTCYEQLVFTNRTKVDSSSIYTEGDYVGSADKTIDRNFDQSFKNCMHTAARKKEAWLRLDLRDIYNLKSVKIWYRNDRITDRLKGYRVLTTHSANTSLDNSDLCYEDPGNATFNTTLEVDCTKTARYVTIYKKDENEAILDICEVEIYGCQHRRYGENCVPCDTCRIDCDITGRCYGFGCINNTGYHGPYCSKCPPGKYGHNCKETCGYCKNNESCHHVTGFCPGLCEPGYSGDKCLTHCSFGTYGNDCKKNCGYCANNDTCHHINGSCPGSCEPGYEGEKCISGCSSGTYGKDCIEKCGHCENNDTCYHINGSCPGSCEAGYEGEKCLTKCQKGFYGQKCTLPCGHCSGNAPCNHVNGSCPGGYCEPGWKHLNKKCDQECRNGTYGHDCKNNCGQCASKTVCDHVTGTCPNRKCAPGWENTQDWKCDTECKNGTYGHGCSNICGHCANKNTCDHVTGSCPNNKCAPGWESTEGRKCDKACQTNFFGKNCSFLCGHCANATCDHVTGSCPSGLCEPGWKNTSDKRCNEECENGTFGSNCRLKCSGHCAGGIPCNKVDGICTEGCAVGWINPYCNNTCRTHFYGKNCSFPCGHCANNVTCDHVTGSCPSGLCKRGWKNISDKRCNEECENGTFGSNCQSKCSGHCAGGISCNKIDGICSEGCAVGWINPYCNDTNNQAPESNSNQIFRPSVYGIIAALFLSILLNIFLIVRNARRAFYKRQSLKKENKEQNSTKETYVTAPGRIEENTAYQELTVQLNNPSINDTEESNAGYQELGQLSQPSHYEELQRF